MACFGSDYLNTVVVGPCPDCGTEVDDEGYAADTCSYSPQVCGTCLSSPFDFLPRLKAGDSC